MDKMPVRCVALKTFLGEESAVSCIHRGRNTVHSSAKSPGQNNLLKYNISIQMDSNQKQYFTCRWK